MTTNTDAEMKPGVNLPDGWAKMPGVPVPKGPPETLEERRRAACQDFLEGRIRDTDGKFFAEYSEKEQAAKRVWLTRDRRC